VFTVVLSVAYALLVVILMMKILQKRAVLWILRFFKTRGANVFFIYERGASVKKGWEPM